MRILYIHQHFCTPAGTGGTRSYEFARRWVRAGHEVHVLCGTGYDPALPDNAELTVEGIRVTTLGVRYLPGMGFARRAGSFLAFAAKSSMRAARTDADVILATSTPLTVALPALAGRWAAGKPLVFEVRDVWPDAAVDAGILTNPLLIAAARLLETTAYQHADHIVPLSTGMAGRILRKGRYGPKCTVIPNCCDLDRFDPALDGGGLRRAHGAEGKFVILYVGAIGASNHVEYLAETARLLRDEPDVQWWFVGGGGRLDYLRRATESAGVENVRFFGLQPKESVPLFAAAADVGVVSFIPQPVYYENSPNKFFDYIAAGLPVVFNRSSWLEPYLRRYNVGWCCRPDSPRDMAQRLRQLRDDEALRIEMGANARRLAEQEFSRDEMASRYLRILEAAAAAARS